MLYRNFKTLSVLILVLILGVSACGIEPAPAPTVTSLPPTEIPTDTPEPTRTPPPQARVRGCVTDEGGRPIYPGLAGYHELLPKAKMKSDGCFVTEWFSPRTDIFNVCERNEDNTVCTELSLDFELTVEDGDDIYLDIVIPSPE